jgi:hypothetical protein
MWFLAFTHKIKHIDLLAVLYNLAFICVHLLLFNAQFGFHDIWMDERKLHAVSSFNIKSYEYYQNLTV